MSAGRFPRELRFADLLHQHTKRECIDSSSSPSQLSSRLVRLAFTSSGIGGALHNNKHQLTTAVPSWDRDASNNRPLSSATEEAPGTAAAEGRRRSTDGGVGPSHHTSSDSVSTPTNNSRPSSAAFRSWMKARPSARSAVSAVSSARTLGMDDPELAHLQLEMESRRGGLSEAALARVRTIVGASLDAAASTKVSRCLE